MAFYRQSYLMDKTKESNVLQAKVQTDKLS